MAIAIVEPGLYLAPTWLFIGDVGPLGRAVPFGQFACACTALAGPTVKKTITSMQYPQLSSVDNRRGRKLMFKGRVRAQVVFIAACAALTATATAGVLGLEYKVHASSTLAEGNLRYPAEDLIPPSLSRPWCEGVKGPGTSESIEMTVKQPAVGEVDLALVPGYAKSDQLYRRNGRPKKIEVLINDQMRQVIEVADRPQEQLFRLKPPIGRKIARVRLTVLDVYMGSEYEDMCVTELLLYPVGERLETMDLKQSEREAASVAALEKEALAGRLDAIEALVRLSDGAYIRSAEGGEWLYEIYVDLFAADPQRFLSVLSTQNETVRSKTLDALANPVSDKYAPAQLLGFLDAAVKKGVDPAMVEGVRGTLVGVQKALSN